MELNNLFVKPINVIVEAKYREVTYEQAKNGEEDELIREEYKGKVVGVVNMYDARIPHLIVLDEEGRFNVEEMHKVTEIKEKADV